MRSASDCVPNKETQIKESKRRTITMNEIGEAMNGSTLELISYQSDGRTCDHHNINLGFCDGNGYLLCMFLEVVASPHYIFCA